MDTITNEGSDAPPLLTCVVHIGADPEPVPVRVPRLGKELPEVKVARARRVALPHRRVGGGRRQRLVGVGAGGAKNAACRRLSL